MTQYYRSSAPAVEPGDWIKVGSIDCVVIESKVVDLLDLVDLVAADLEVVCNPTRPAVYPVRWDGEIWTFDHPMLGEYAEHHPTDVTQYVELLRQGPKSAFNWERP